MTMMRRYLPEVLLFVILLEGTRGFLQPILEARAFSATRPHQHQSVSPTKFRNEGTTSSSPLSSSSTALNVWWFGGSDSEQSTLQQTGDDSCELVAVRIERPTSNSRKIFGEIAVPVPMEDVWAILTDYDRLSIHVPNLVESRIVQRNSGGEQGDGRFRCRLFQRGAQEIVGFQFGASVTMDMVESAYDVSYVLPPTRNGNAAAAAPPQTNGRTAANGQATSKNGQRQQSPHSSNSQRRERKIGFKCVDSFFFNEFDGEWSVMERLGDNGQTESLLSYVVFVKPKGPVPVAALEWRIREDVPTNLRAVKKAAQEVGFEGVMASRVPKQLAPARRNGTTQPTRTSTVADSPAQQRRRRMDRVLVQWDESETLSAYLEKP